jgi:hypothetical protein
MRIRKSLLCREGYCVAVGALSSNNAANAAAAGSTAAAIDSSGSLVYNGAAAGVDFMW